MNKDQQEEFNETKLKIMRRCLHHPYLPVRQIRLIAILLSSILLIAALLFISMDYSEWERSNGLKLNDDDKEEKEVEEEKGVIKKLIKKFKNLLHKLGKRR